MFGNAIRIIKNRDVENIFLMKRKIFWEIIEWLH